MSSPKFIDFSNSSMIQLDIETKDPNLKDFGSGVYRKDGYIIGVALGDMEGHKEYYPLAHPETTKNEADRNLDYIKKILQLNKPFIGANLKYDFDWLHNGYGLPLPKEIHDIQLAEPLLDEYRIQYNLEALSQFYLQESKTNDEPYRWCLQHGIQVRNRFDAVKHLWKMPADIVKPYACGDVDLPGRIFQFQKAALERQGLWNIYRLECDLTPALLQMRRTGVLLDRDRMLSTGMQLADAVYTGEKLLAKKLGRKVNLNSSNDLKWIADKLGLEYSYRPPTSKMLAAGRTKGNPRLDKDALKSMHHPIMQTIVQLKHLKTLNNMFIKPYEKMLVGDRLYGDFNQLKSDDYGTVSGRLSGSNPNLQQVAAREEEFDENMVSLLPNIELLKGKVIRDFFIPEQDMDWLKNDWSQVEYRVIAHYAIGPRSEEIRNKYRDNPKTDYHEEMGKMTGLKERKVVKTLNFGAAYGMGPKTMSVKYNWSLEYAKQVYFMYHDKVPFVRETSTRVSNKAKRVGYIKTILGRRARLTTSDKAYVMFNRLIQGSAADIMKTAILEAYNKKLFDALPVHLTVHDELDNSMPRTKEGLEAAKELKYTMENCVKLRVPIIADSETGPTWGTLKDLEFN